MRPSRCRIYEAWNRGLQRGKWGAWGLIPEQAPMIYIVTAGSMPWMDLKEAWHSSRSYIVLVARCGVAPSEGATGRYAILYHRRLVLQSESKPTVFPPTAQTIKFREKRARRAYSSMYMPWRSRGASWSDGANAGSGGITGELGPLRLRMHASCVAVSKINIPRTSCIICYQSVLRSW